MLLEERVKEHIKDLQRNIKSNILEDVGGKVRHAISQRDFLFTQGSAFNRGSGWHHPIVVFRQGEEA